MEIFSLYKRIKVLPSRKYQDGITQQSFAKEVNIHNIIDKYRKTGVMPSGTRQPSFGDFGDVEDYMSSLNHINDAQEAFMQLDPKIRDRFANDPAKLIAFLSKEENKDEAKKLGLVVEPAPKAPDIGDVVNAIKEQTAASSAAPRPAST